MNDRPTAGGMEDGPARRTCLTWFIRPSVRGGQNSAYPPTPPLFFRVVLGQRRLHRSGHTEVDFLSRTITVRGENGPQSCIIDCEQDGRGFYFRKGEANDSIGEGLTIRNGFVDENSQRLGWGGGILCWTNSGPTVRDCHLLKNSG